MNTGINMKRRTNRTSVFLILALLLVSAACQILPALAEPVLSAESEKEFTAGVPANFPPQYQVDSGSARKYGEGTTFTFTLPFVVEKEENK